MILTKSTFRDERINAYCMGAGVIPYAIAPDGRIYFLLARECFVPDWKSSSRWSAFEGARAQTERVTETASREFFEESMGLIYNREEIPDRLEHGEFLFRVVLRITGDQRTERYHCSYVMEIPWDRSLPKRFSILRNNLLLLQNKAAHMHDVRPFVAVPRSIR